MRSLVLIGVLAALVLPGNAADKTTIAQLEQMIAQHSVRPRETPGKQSSLAPDEIHLDLDDSDLLHQLEKDDDLIPKIESIELTERMSTLTLYRLVGKYNLGPHLQQVLEQLADRSALLKLPPAEQLPQPAPDAAAQVKTLAEARSYVIKELAHLPNFMATETTTRFDTVPVALRYFQSETDSAGFHRVGADKHQITFRDGKEVVDESHAPSDPRQPDPKQKDNGLQSRGEFGAEAAVVLMDLEKGSATFDHWEQTMGGPAVVYRYSVPREASHYEVTDECQEHVSFHDTPAYQGELAVDPKSGAILRMTLETESNPGDPVSHIASVVEYGPVVLGNRRSICPLRSLTFMVQETNGCTHGKQKLEKPVAMINQTIFSNYHRFGSSVTMIVNEAENGHTPPQGAANKVQPGGGKGSPIGPAVTGQSRRP
ncbi:MAG TPA: hypothetical protein VGI45_15265 [Terracidiphilus sp.]|jgi:hypothetical protein